MKTPESTTADKPRRPRIGALLNAGVTLGAAIAILAMRGPKLPPASGD